MGEVRRVDAGAVVVDPDHHLRSRRRDPDHDARPRVLQRVLHQVRDHLTEAIRIRVESDRATRGHLEGQPEVDRRGHERLRSVGDDATGVDRPGRESELVRVEAREVEEIGDEALQAPCLGADDARGASLRVRVGEHAVGERLGVPADRGQRCPQVVRDAEQEGALVTARHLELLGHLIDRSGEAAQLVVRDPARVDPRREIAGGDGAGRGLHRGDRRGESPREVRGGQRGNPEREERRSQDRAASVAEWTRLDLLGEHDDGCEVLHRLEGNRGEDGIVDAARLRPSRRERSGIEVALRHWAGE